MNAAPTLGVVTTDRQLAIRGWNDWVAAATGRTEADVAGRSLIDFVAPERADFYRELLTEVVERGSARVLAPAFHKFLIPCRPRTPSAHFDHMQQRVTAAPLIAGDSIVGVMVTLEDVTARLDHERSVAELQDPAAVATGKRTEALASEDWRIRGEAVRRLQRSATVDELRHLFDTLERDHHDLNVLNSALRVLIAAGRNVIEPLIELLGNDAANLRMHAALALGELRAREAATGLVGSLEDPDENVRFHAIEALGRIGAAESVEPLARIAASDNFFLAFAAVDALSRTDDARVAPLMVSLLDQDLLRPAAVGTLAAIGDEDSVPALAESLNHGDREAGPIAEALTRIFARYEDILGAGSFIVESARGVIGNLGQQQLIAAAGRDDEYRLAAATVLSWLGRPAMQPLLDLVGEPSLSPVIAEGLLAIGPDVVPALIDRLESSSPTARVASAELLGRLGDRRATAPLLEALDGADAELAAAAAAALGNLGDASALDGLVRLFAHPGALVRRAAIAAVNTIGSGATAAAVRTALADDDPRVRECGLRVAGYFGYAEDVPVIIKALTDPSEDIRRAAIEQLPVLDEPDVIARLIEAMSNETARNRAAAAHAMRLVDDPRSESALVTALGDGDAWVRYFAASSLAESRAGESAAQALAALARSDPANHVRIAAVTALGQIGAAVAIRVAGELIGDADDDLAIAAIKVLGGIPRSEARAQLARAAQADRPALPLAAARALAVRPTMDSVELLAWAARVNDVPGLPEEAIQALKTIGGAGEHPIAQRAAITALRDLAAEGTRRLEVIGALARLPELAVPEIASGLSAGRVDVRVATVDALAAMRQPRASAELARALRDEDPIVRAAAVSGFAKLGTPAVSRTIAAMRENDPDEGVRRSAEVACARHLWGTALLRRS